MRGAHGERLARLELSLVVEPGDGRLAALLQELRPSDVLDAVRRGSASVPALWRERAAGSDDRVRSVLALGRERGLRWVVPGDREWPAPVDDLVHLTGRGVGASHDAGGAPVGLWVRGSGRLDEVVEQSVAVVGARDCTAYGSELASELAADLVDADVGVVSGAAFGIDAAAHRGALALGGPTLAVLACGADLDYPRANAALLSRIATDGVIVSEQPPGQVPTKSRFLSRNRLIAALASATVVVEAAVRSGSLNTLRWAEALGRPAMAVPGPVSSQQSAGCHRAIRDGRAVLVTEGREVLAELRGPGVLPEAPPGGPSTEFDRLPAPARCVLDALDWDHARDVSEVSTAATVTARETRRALELLRRRGLAESSAEGWLLARRADLA